MKQEDKKSLPHLLGELSHYAETGQPHPRKMRAKSQAREQIHVEDRSLTGRGVVGPRIATDVTGSEDRFHRAHATALP